MRFKQLSASSLAKEKQLLAKLKEFLMNAKPRQIVFIMTVRINSSPVFSVSIESFNDPGICGSGTAFFWETACKK